MDITAPSANNNEQRVIGPQNKSSVIDDVSSFASESLGDVSRMLGADLSAINQNLASSGPADIQNENYRQENEGITAVRKILNLGKSIGSKGLNIAGFIGVSLAAISFIFRFKVISAILGFSSIAPFYMSNRLKHSIKESESKMGFSADPTKMIAKARDDSIFLENNFEDVMAAMIKLGEMKDSDPRKLGSLKDLWYVAKKVAAKRSDIQATDSRSHKLLEIKKFMDIYDSVKIPQYDLNAKLEEIDIDSSHTN